MKFPSKHFVISAVFLGAIAVDAAELPKNGDVELDFSGGISHVKDGASYGLYGKAGWFASGGHQIGGSLYGMRSESDSHYQSNTYTQLGWGLFYRYNYFLTGKRFWPYAGLEYLSNHTKSVSKYDGPPDERYAYTINYWVPAIGMKFMLADNVAFDVSLTHHKETPNENNGYNDRTAANIGLSIFF